MDNLMLSEERLEKIIINDKNDIRLDKIKKIIKSELYNLLCNYFTVEKDTINIDIKYVNDKYKLHFDCKFDNINMCNCI